MLPPSRAVWEARIRRSAGPCAIIVPMFIHDSRIVLLRFYDCADEIALDRVAAELFAGNSPLRRNLVRVDNKSIELVDPPLSVDLGERDWALPSGDVAARLSARFFSYGVVSLAAEVTLADLPFSAYLHRALALDNERRLVELFESELSAVLAVLRPSMKGEHPFREFQEEYTIYELARLDRALSMRDLADLPELTCLVYGEREPVSEQQRRLAIENAFAYFEDDLVVLNYDNALLVGGGDTGDLRLLLEFALVQLLEARYYDRLLTRRLAALYEDMDRRPAGMVAALFTSKWSDLTRRAMRLVLETELMTDHLTSAVRVTEDVYYAQIYSRALRMFRTDGWLRKMDEKLRSLKDAHALMNGEIAARRSEMLEWIIILLIAFEIVQPFVMRLLK